MRVTSQRRGFRSEQAVGRSVAEFHNRRWRPSAALRALDQLSAGVIIADNDRRVVEMNRAAESIVGLEDGLNIRKDRLCAQRAFETDRIGKLIADATTRGQPGAAAGRMLVRRSDSLPPYVLTVAPLRTDAGDDRQFALIVVVDPARHSPSEQDLAEFFGLSPAESRLAASLLTGKTLSQIAANTGVRMPTLRTQLGSIMRKSGTQRQSDLIRVLSTTGIGSVSLTAACLDVAMEALQIPLLLAGV
jgi:DNA-binding CsgD family transcriptional regulator